jgi:hypothetical protein
MTLGAGITVPIEIVFNVGKSGIMLKPDDSSRERRIWDADAGQVIRLRKPKNAPQVPSEWIETGKAVQRIQSSRFCDESLLLSLLEQRTFLAASGAVEQYFGCFQVPNPGFASRASLMLADICSNTAVASHISDGEFVWLDAYGRGGGMSDYILWRNGADGLGIGVRGFVLESPTDRQTGKSFQDHPFRSSQRETLTRLEICAEQSGNLVQVQSKLGVYSGNVHLAVFDGMEADAEYQSIPCFLEQCVLGLGVLRKDGTFICRISDIFSRMMGGALYLLTYAFESVTLIKPAMSCPSSPEKFLVCSGFNGVQECVHLRRHLEKIHSMVIAERGLGLGTDVLTLIATPALLKDPFLSDLTKICEKMCRQEVSAIQDFIEHKDCLLEGIDFTVELERMGLPTEDLRNPQKNDDATQ